MSGLYAHKLVYECLSASLYSLTAQFLYVLNCLHSAEMLGIEPELLREEHKVKKINRFDGQEFPDPSSWTVDQVYQFIRTADGDMYANGAEAFKREVSGFGCCGGCFAILCDASSGRVCIHVGWVGRVSGEGGASVLSWWWWFLSTLSADGAETFNRNTSDCLWFLQWFGTQATGTCALNFSGFFCLLWFW